MPIYLEFAVDVESVHQYSRQFPNTILHSQLSFHGHMGIFLNLVEHGSVFWQSQSVFKSNGLVTSAQHVRHEIGRRRNATPYTVHSKFIGHATFGGQLHGKATAVQASHFFLFLGTQKGNASGGCVWMVVKDGHAIGKM
jgi:hypothetical protein